MIMHFISNSLPGVEEVLKLRNTVAHFFNVSQCFLMSSIMLLLSYYRCREIGNLATLVTFDITRHLGGLDGTLRDGIEPDSVRRNRRVG